MVCQGNHVQAVFRRAFGVGGDEGAAEGIGNNQYAERQRRAFFSPGQPRVYPDRCLGIGLGRDNGKRVWKPEIIGCRCAEIGFSLLFLWEKTCRLTYKFLLLHLVIIKEQDKTFNFNT